MKIIDCEQGSPEWHGYRMGILTASDCDRILTKSGKPSASKDDYAAELIDELVRPLDLREADELDARFRGNRHTERGHELEPKARDWYRFVTGSDVRQVGFVLADNGRMGCSPDSLIYAGDAIVRGLEIKAPEGKKHARWMIDGILPDEHRAQVHASMVITGLRRWDFGSYCPGYQPLLVAVEWDAYTDLMAKALSDFLADLEIYKRKFVDYLPLALEAA